MAKQMQSWDELTAAEIREAYEVALETRAAIVNCMALKTRGEGVEFWIGGPGEEIHGAATAMAFHRALREEPEQPREVGYVGHYRSDALAAMTYRLRGREGYVRDYFRQALTRTTDPFSLGRQMSMHLCLPEIGLLPFQSPVGLQLGKAAGYARALQLLDRGGVAVAVIGDGTVAESDMHEAMHAASLWNLPLVIVVTDNHVGISVTPDDGRAVRDLAQYAQAFGLRHYACDGHDLLDTWRTTLACARTVRDEGGGAILHADVPRLMGHSSSSGGQFDYDQRDPLLELGNWLVDQGVLEQRNIFQRGERDPKKGYFEVHQLGTLMEEKLDEVRGIVEEVKAEPEPSYEAGDAWRHTHPPVPEVREPEPERDGTTRVQYNEAINHALDRALAERPAAIWGQDVARIGGIFQCTAGLARKYPEHVRDAPINEPMIVGTAVGAGMHPELATFPEIQFGDYSLNCLHWFVHMGNLHWSTGGQVSPNVTVRFPVDPVGGGAIYHSMSCDGFYGNVPGVVLSYPSCTWDAYGLLRTATDYEGPVIQMEPKRLYRQRQGPPLPGEPDDAKHLRELRKAGETLPFEDFHVPFGTAARRREGDDVVVVTWGMTVWQAVAAADAVAEESGIEAEVLDLRTIKPYDRDAILEAAERTGRVLIAHADRTFAGFGRQIQGDVLETLPGALVRVVGQLDTPGVAQSRALEDAITLQESDIRDGIEALADEAPEAWLEHELHWLRYADTARLT